jgi:hypothetical protein
LRQALSALERSRIAIDDWLNTYAEEHCDAGRVAEAQRRISDEGGTVHYIAVLQQSNRAAIKALAAAIGAQPQPKGKATGKLKAVYGDKWEGAEEWMPLAWELCANECGEEACTELIWEGGPIPEPWGDRWMKYEDQAKEMIAMVRASLAAAQAPAPAQGSWVSAEDVQRLARDLDIAINGEAGAATAPQLCDVVAQAVGIMEARRAEFPVVARWTGGAKDAGPRARVWVQFEDGGAEVEFAPATLQAPAVGADDDMLQPLIYAAIMHHGTPKTVAEFERAAANVADMLARRLPRDAARYRALRDWKFSFSPQIVDPTNSWLTYTPEGLDKVCDAMIDIGGPHDAPKSDVPVQGSQL